MCLHDRFVAQILATIHQLMESLKKKEQNFQEFVLKYGRFLSNQQRRQPEQTEARESAKAATGVLV